MIITYSEELNVLGLYVLKPLEPHPKLELVTVMIMIPLVFNILQLWIQDSFLKAKQGSKSPVVVMRDSIDKL